MRPEALWHTQEGQKPRGGVLLEVGEEEEEEYPTEASLLEAFIHQLRSSFLEQTSTTNPNHNWPRRVQEAAEDSLFCSLLSFVCKSLTIALFIIRHLRIF